MLEAVQDAVGAGLLGYLPPAVRRDLGAAVSDWYARRWGWSVPADQVMPVGDVREALRIAVDTFSRPGSAVVVPTPAYMPFLTAPVFWGREVQQVPMAVEAGRHVLDLDALGAAFRAGGHLLVLVNPQNPTGTVHTADELRAVADVVAAHDGMVLADEVHAPLVHHGHRHVPYASVSPTAAAHTLTATSASKGWNVPGLKCAQVLVADPGMLARWRSLDAHLTGGASTLGAIANTAAWRAGGAWLDDLVEQLGAHRAAFAAELSARAGDLIGHHPAEGTYLAWVDLRAALDRRRGTTATASAPDGAPAAPDDVPDWRTAEPGALSRWVLRRTGVAVTDGASCGEAGRGHVRVTLATPEPLVREAATRLATLATDR